MFQKVSKLPNRYYFQHTCIPGLAFDEFLADQVMFLDQHPTVIVVIHTRNDNVVEESKKPTEEEIYQHLDAACSEAQNQPLTWGRRECFSKPIDSLRSTGQRIIVVIMADKYDSWTSEAYATLKVDPILARFESMTTEGQLSTNITVLQCQATSQSIKEVLVYRHVISIRPTKCSSTVMNGML